MIDITSVIMIIQEMGIVPEEDINKITPFCAIAIAQLTDRLKNEEYGKELTVQLACATTAIYNYCLFCGADTEEFSSFKAGDVTVSRSYSSVIENAAKLRDEAILSATPYLKDIDFVFEAVEV